MGFVFLLAGLANTWSILYFRSDDYSGGQEQVNEQMYVVLIFYTLPFGAKQGGGGVTEQSQAAGGVRFVLWAYGSETL